MFNLNVQNVQQLNPNSRINPKNPIQARFISFGNADTVSIKNITAKAWADNISPETQKEIIEAMAKADFDNDKPLGMGADGNVFRLDGGSNGMNSFVVKISHNKDKNPQTGQMQRVGETFEKEQAMLVKAGKLSPNSQMFVGSLKIGDQNALVSTLVPGKSPSYPNNPFNKKSLGSILSELNTLDERGVLHRDLKKENVFVDANDNAGLLDYGASIPFDLKDFDKNIKENHFAPFEAPTNLKNLESTLIAPYMYDMSKFAPNEMKNFYTDYLSARAENMHEPAALRLKNYAKTADLTPDEKKKISEMAHYQELCAKVLKNPTQSVQGVEFLKSQIAYNSELAYKNEILLLNPLANVTLKFNALIAAKKLEKTTDELLKKPQEVATKEYLQYQREFAHYQLEKISGWTKGLTDWLLTCMTTPIAQAEDYKKPIIDQMTEKDLNDFEIPNPKLGV